MKKKNNISIGHLDDRWNIGELGWRPVRFGRQRKMKSLGQAYFLHWNGQNKPWLSNTRRRKFRKTNELWIKYIPKKFNFKTISDWISFSN